jgi:hypothetical protein
VDKSTASGRAFQPRLLVPVAERSILLLLLLAVASVGAGQYGFVSFHAPC